MMFTGFLIADRKSVKMLSSVEDYLNSRNDDRAFVWLDMLDPSKEELTTVGRSLKLHPHALDDCREGEQRPRIDDYGDYLSFVLYGVVGIGKSENHDPKKLVAFLAPDFLLTVHPLPIKTMHDELARVRKNPSLLAKTSTDEILFRLIDGMVDKFVFVINGLTDEAEELEDRSMEPEVNEDVLQQTMALRRRILDFSRLARSKRELIHPLTKGQFDHLSESLAFRFRHVEDHLTQVIELADSIRDRLHSIHDNFHAALAAKTNKSMKTLTVVATAMLPMSLIAGIYGMNVPLWPSTESSASFWGVLCFMILTGAGLILLLSRRL